MIYIPDKTDSVTKEPILVDNTQGVEYSLLIFFSFDMDKDDT